MGMTLSKEAHDQFHRKSPTLSAEQHDVPMKKLGITREQDEEWHRTHLALAQQRAEAMRGLTRSTLSRSAVTFWHGA